MAGKGPTVSPVWAPAVSPTAAFFLEHSYTILATLNIQGVTMRISEAAKRIGVHPATLRRYVKQGRLHCTTPGDQRIFTEKDLQDFQATYQTPNNPTNPQEPRIAFYTREFDGGRTALQNQYNKLKPITANPSTTTRTEPPVSMSTARASANSSKTPRMANTTSSASPPKTASLDSATPTSRNSYNNTESPSKSWTARQSKHHKKNYSRIS